LVWEAWKAATVIHEGVDEMRWIVANTTLNLYSGGLQEVREVECLEVTLTEDEIAYRESVKDVGPSTSIPSPSMSISGTSSSVPDPSMSVPDPFMS
jgi:hypothetical protein